MRPLIQLLCTRREKLAYSLFIYLFLIVFFILFLFFIILTNFICDKGGSMNNKINDFIGKLKHSCFL